MSLKSDNIIEQLTLAAERLKRELRIVETGTIRKVGDEYEHGDGHSTTAIARWVKRNGGEFASIDLKTETSAKYLKKKRLFKYVNLVQGYSTKVLRKLGRIDFAYLDSENDAELTFKEFKMAWRKVVKCGCIMIDDCNVKSAELHKGDMVVPYLEHNDIKFTQYSTNQIAIIR